MKGQFGQSVIQVKRAELLDRIKANRDTHRAAFEAAWKGYETAVREWFESNVKRIHEGKRPTTTAFAGPVPQDHTEDYDRVIDMLQMEIRDELEIDERAFSMYVRDDWDWKHQFVTSNAVYTGG